MTEALVLVIVLVAAVIAGSIVYVRRRKSDGEWSVRVTCAQCGLSVPRWFLLDKGTARGPVSLYRYPIPTACRICRYKRGIRPIAWQEGETEAMYNARSEKATAELIASRMR